MKKLFTLLMLITVIVCTAQSNNQKYDLIIKTDKTEVKAKVLQIEEYNVVYKKFENIEGPSYNISKSDIFMILYANGTKETFDTPKPAQTATPSYSSQVVQQAATTGAHVNKPVEIQGASGSSNIVDFSYNPLRIFYNFGTRYDLSLTITGEENVGRAYKEANASIFSHFNLGVTLSGSEYTEEVLGASSTVTVFDVGLYTLWYFPVNKLRGQGNINRGLYPYTYLGAVLRNTSGTTSFGGNSSEFDEYTGDVTAGFGVDLRISGGFGFSANYDITYGTGLGISFLF